MSKGADWLRQNFPAILQRFKLMLIAVGFISIMAGKLWVRGISIVLFTAIFERAIVTVPDKVHNLAKNTLTEWAKTGGMEQLTHEAKIAAGGAIGGAGGGFIGGAIRAYLTGTFSIFEPLGVALGIVLGRILSKSLSNSITDNKAQLGGAIGAGIGSMTGAIVGGSGVVLCSLAGLVVGGLVGGAMGAVRVSSFGKWPEEKFISMVSATAMGLVMALHGVIGLLGCLAVIVTMLTMPLQDKQVAQTSTNGDDEKKEKNKSKEDKQQHLEALKPLRSLLVAIGFVATLSSGAPGTIFIVVKPLPLFCFSCSTKDMNQIVSQASWKLCAKMKSERIYEDRAKIGVASEVNTELFVNPCSIGSIIGGAAGGTIGGLINTLLQATHPVIGQVVGGAVGAMVGWTLGKAFTTDMLKNGPKHKWAAGAIGGTLGGVAGASFSFIMGGVGGGLTGGVMGMGCDKYFEAIKKNM